MGIIVLVFCFSAIDFTLDSKSAMALSMISRAPGKNPLVVISSKCIPESFISPDAFWDCFFGGFICVDRWFGLFGCHGCHLLLFPFRFSAALGGSRCRDAQRVDDIVTPIVLGFKSLHSQRDDLFTGLHGMKAQCFSFGMKFRPLGKDQTPKIDLTFSPNCGMIRVSRWRPTFVALPLGNVSVSYPLQRG